jgi:multidrug resistance efflux pump
MSRAEVDGVVLQTHVKPGGVVTAKDLLVEFAAS